MIRDYGEKDPISASAIEKREAALGRLAAF
jgi:hypothetical protein